MLPDGGDVFVTGDLHGDVAAFDRIVEIADLLHHPVRHLVLQELVHGHDDEGGGRGSCVLVEKAARLITRFPQRVHLLMGNHEMAELTGRTILKDGVVLNQAFANAVTARYDGRGEEAAAVMREFWRALPLAARTGNGIFIAHSTPSRDFLDNFTPDVLGRPLENADFARSGPAYALCWGRDFTPDVANRFAGLLGVEYLVVGHTPCDNGFLTPNERHIVLDSQGPSGKYLLAPLEGNLTYAELVGRIRPIWG